MLVDLVVMARAGVNHPRALGLGTAGPGLVVAHAPRSIWGDRHPARHGDGIEIRTAQLVPDAAFVVRVATLEFP